MDPDREPRKVKFKPKPPRSRTPARVDTPPIESVDDDDDDAETLQSLNRKVKDHLAKHRRKVEKKSSVQVAFSHVVASDAIATFGKQKEGTGDGTNEVYVEELPLDDMKWSPSIETHKSLAVDTGNQITPIFSEGTEEVMEDLLEPTTMDVVKKKREYMEPWDYEHSNYPTTLPWRRPYSGNPELLDKDEFEEGDEEYDEKSLNPAIDLGLLEQDNTPKMLFFQFPRLPLARRAAYAGVKGPANNSKPFDKTSTTQNPSGLGSATPKGKEITSSVTKGKEIAGTSVSRNPSRQLCSLEDLPEGHVGKMIVYKSGAVKLKLGDLLYDVCPGTECTFAQHVMAMDTKSKNCCKLGGIDKRVVVSADVDFLLDSARTELVNKNVG